MEKFRYAIAARAVALAVKKSLSEHNKKPKIKLQQQELTEMEHDEFLQVIRSPFHFATCDAVLRGCKIVNISKPLQWRRLSKKMRSPLGPLCEGAPPAGGGGENCTAARNISGYGKVFSLRPFGAPPSQREVFRHAALSLYREGFSYFLLTNARFVSIMFI